MIGQSFCRLGVGAVPGGRAGAERDSKCEAPAGLEVPDEEKDASHFTGISIHIQRSGKRGLFHASAAQKLRFPPYVQPGSGRILGKTVWAGV